MTIRPYGASPRKLVIKVESPANRLLRIATVLQWHLTIVGIVGGFSIGFGGTVAVLTPDIKQIIAYSTTSQLG